MSSFVSLFVLLGRRNCSGRGRGESRGHKHMQVEQFNETGRLSMSKRKGINFYT